MMENFQQGDDEDEQRFREWVETRPACVRKLIEEFPPGSRFTMLGRPYYLIGYTEDDHLIVTPLSPWDDWEAALAAQKYVCAKHFRQVVH